MMHRRLRPGPSWVLPAAGGLLLVALLTSFSGCGSDDPQTIVIELQPWGIDFNSAPDAQLQTQYYMYMTELAFYESVLRFQRINGVYQLIGSVATPTAGGFHPLALDVGTGASEDVLFVADTYQGAQRLLALNPAFVGDQGLDGLLLAETGGPSPETFLDLRGLASLRLDDDTYRVFLSDDNRVWIIDYGVTAKAFTFGSPGSPPIIEEGCGETLRTPSGVAVDGAVDPLTRLPALLVADKGKNALFRFSGIGGATPLPVCNCFFTEWDGGSDYFDAPRGVTVLSGGSVPADALVVVADARKTDSGNDRVGAFSWNNAASTFEPEPLPEGFVFYPGAAPFDLAFDAFDQLWATYPEAGAIAGPAQ